MEDILVPIALFASIFGICYVFFITRNKERLALIEKGADAKLFHKERRPYPVLKYGMFFVGVAIGVLLGNVLAVTWLEDAVAYISMICLFGGLALILFHLIEKKLKA